jgi:ribosomal protein S27E
MATTQPLKKHFPCPGCGADLEFNPALGQLACPYCGHQATPTQAEPEENGTNGSDGVVERDFQEFMNANQTQIAALSTTAQEVECPGCRAQITFQPPDVAGKCPFCGTNIVAQPHSASPVITPESLLPFKFDQKAARQKMKRWLSRGNWFAPNGLKKLAQHERMQGVYLPFWTYDSQTRSRYSGERGEYYYTTETYTVTNSDGEEETRTRQVRHTRWYPASGTVSRFFDDVLVPAITSVDLNRLEQLEPWPLKSLVPYNASYLAGFKAQRYQVQLKEGFSKAKSRMASTIESDVRCDIGGDTQRVHSISTDYSEVTFKHILLPVWMCSYRFKNKSYQVMINAQTGEVLGDRPISVFKVALAIIAGIVAVGGFILGKGWLDSQPQPQPQPAPIETPQPQTPQSQALPSAQSAAAPVPAAATDPFQAGLNYAMQAAELTQIAQSQQDWQQVSSLWIQAIERMKAVPPGDPNYNAAQERVQQYQNNLNYARQQAAR